MYGSAVFGIVLFGVVLVKWLDYRTQNAANAKAELEMQRKHAAAAAAAAKHKIHTNRDLVAGVTDPRLAKTIQQELDRQRESRISGFRR